MSYQVGKYNGQGQRKGNQLVPSMNQRLPQTPSVVIPTSVQGNRNVAGQIKTKIHLKNARGEEMDIYQTQQILNLMNGQTGNWGIGSQAGIAKQNRYTNKKRRYK